MGKPRPPGVRGLDWLQQRDHAETIPCPDCNAPAGQTCTRTSWHTGETTPLDHLPAHIARSKAAGPIPDNTQESRP